MPAFGQSRNEKIDALQPISKPKAFTTTETNTLPVSNIGIVNLEQKKKPHNIQIKNNKKEPKITPNVKYTDKQRFRKYKTKTEPNLHSKIEINEEDDIVNKIKEAFGIKSEKQNTNYSEEITAPAPFNNGVDEPPETETKIYSSSVSSGFHNLKGYEEWYNLFNDGKVNNRQEPYEGYNQERLYELDDISPETRQELTFQADPPDEYYEGYIDKEITDKEGNYHVIQVPAKINRRTAGYIEEEPEDLGLDLFNDSEFFINPQPRRLSGAPTPQRKGDNLDMEIEKTLSPNFFTPKGKRSGRPLGGQALIRKQLEAIDLSENREATLKDFKERKRSNIANKKTQMNYKDVIEQLNRNEYSMLKYYNSL
jgi:hypothetical protein